MSKENYVQVESKEDLGRPQVGSKRTDEVEHGEGSASAAPNEAAKAACGVFERAKGTQ